MVHDNDLADFLRARRRSLAPEEAGLDPGGDRRVAGLRREEVAELAGVSADYYRRLEQGRERHPSHQVLVSLARALQLDDHASRHLFEIVMPATHFARTCSPREVSDGVRLLIEHSLRVPASVVGPASDVLAINRLAAALYSPFARVDNLAMMVFLDSAARDFYTDWETVARTSVASLRAASTQFPREPRIAEVIGELSLESKCFAGLWAEHEVRPRVEDEKVFRHPVAGELRVKFEALSISGAPGQRIYVYTPLPDTPGAQALTELAEGCAPAG
ncbi:helix-turn-helix transcriptional regulator [Amycolatopsis pithecellobii]|uniref:helix-turn-helix transcriptional regulator n=1 Tax=Amycolatopsis pithecellobii TaxID=664692 RepID=UPI001AA0208B|nr:helix-turn-helix transcriptional regulator [Amycolatopsis pithecellobii]